MNASAEERFVDAAAVIGARLCAAAQWDRRGRSCAWDGNDVIETPGEEPEVVQHALGGSLYGGSAGVAYFLAHLHRARPQAAFLKTARGAMRHALDWAQHGESGPFAVSLFMGPLGVAYAIGATELGEFTPALQPIVEDARRNFSAAPRAQKLDVISGSAGAIMALLALHRRAPDAHLVDFAQTLGADLAARADWTQDWCAWDMREAANFDSPPLSGFSHGASGMALALLEFHRVTGDETALVTARGGYAYEDSLFDPERRNWRDLRFAGHWNAAEAPPVYWCHGAGGILLSRLRAAKLDTAQSGRHRAVAQVAAQTVLEALALALEAPRGDATLCHGACGLIEALNVAHAELDEQRFADAAIAGALALLDKHGAAQDWPSGVLEGGYTPSLLVGEAGIGLTFLRLARRDLAPPITTIA